MGEAKQAGARARGPMPAVAAAGGIKTECGGKATSKKAKKWPYVEQNELKPPFPMASRPLTEVLIETQSGSICRNS